MLFEGGRVGHDCFQSNRRQTAARAWLRSRAGRCGDPSGGFLSWRAEHGFDRANGQAGNCVSLSFQTNALSNSSAAAAARHTGRHWPKQGAAASTAAQSSHELCLLTKPRASFARIAGSAQGSASGSEGVAFCDQFFPLRGRGGVPGFQVLTISMSAAAFVVRAGMSVGPTRLSSCGVYWRS